MKKILLTTVALAALGAPALAADMAARALHQGAAYRRSDLQLDRLLHRRPCRRRLRQRQQFRRPRHRQQRRRRASSAACRAAPTISSRRTGCSVSKASTPGSATATAARSSRSAATSSTTTSAPRLGHRPPRLHLGSRPALREGRLRLFRQPRDAAARRRSGRPSPSTSDHRDGYTVGAGLEYMFAPNWSAKVEYQYYDFGNAAFTAPVALAPFGSFRNDEHTVKAGINYRFDWRRPGGREVLIDELSVSLCGKGRRQAGLFCLPSRKNSAARPQALSRLVNRVSRYCRRFSTGLGEARWRSGCSFGKIRFGGFLSRNLASGEACLPPSP